MLPRIRRGLLLVALPALLLAFLARSAPALAAPSWGVEMTHENAYGAEGAVDPHTGSATTFARESGFNSYTITVKNTGDETAEAKNVVGGTLSCEAGGNTAGATVAYQWLRSGAVISGATGSTYTLKAGAPPTGDEGAAVQCEVTASDSEGADVAISSNSLVAPSPAVRPPAEGRAEAFIFGRKVGETVSCESLGWTSSPTSFEYQWLRNGVAISGASSGPTSATSVEYTLTPADAGKAIQCEVTATNAGGSAAAVSEGSISAAAVAAPPASISGLPPTLTPSGTVSVGETLTCNEDVLGWEGSPTSYKFQWLRNGVAISSAEGGTASTYTLKGGAPPTGDEGAAIQCQVTAVNAEGATSAVSSQDVVSPSSTPPPTNIAAPEFEVGVGVGGTPECYSPGSWEGEPTSYEYQWLRNGASISGATGHTYTLTAADVGEAIQCEVTATNTGGSVAALSTATVVLPSLPEPSVQTPVGISATVTDQLPAGLVLAGTDAEAEASGTGWSCTIPAGNGSVACTRSEALAPGAAYPPITLHVHVNPEAPVGTPPGGGVTNTAKVEGGGAPSVSVGDPTTIAAAVPFGIESFTRSVTGSLGEPFTQAGGHPFATSVTFVLDSTTDDANGELRNVGGFPRDVSAELPPGFVGDPQASVKCQLNVFQKAIISNISECHEDTQVGFAQVSLLGTPKAGPTYAGSSWSPIYNLQPAPGHPAEFGFINSTQAFTLAASVRSDGDYGITVGDYGITDSPAVLAFKLTFCENGSTITSRSGNGEATGVACDPVSAGSKPFLTGPTRCEGPAPVTTLRADDYADPAAYVSKTVYTGTNLVGGAPSASESFVTGCNLLQFQPEVQFKPSSAAEGGTTQADQPTGATFDLKVPQTSEAEAQKNATPELKDATVSFPAGMSVDPSAADGLQACSNAEFGLGSSVEPAVPSECPLASQIGTMEIFEPLLSGAPKVLGPAEKGQGLSCVSGVWNGNPGFSYQWLRDGAPIPGASSEFYVPVAADEGKAVQCQVTASNAGGSSVEVDRVADVIEPEPPTAVSIPPANLPAPSGAPSIGGVLSCDAEAGSWSGSPAFSYEWLRGGVPIAGASGGEYTLGGEDAGETVQCEVVATTGGGVVVDDSAAVIIAPSPSVEPPLLGTPIHGKLFLAEPLCGGERQPPCEAADASEGKLVRLFLEADDPTDGVIIKVPGSVAANTTTGQLTATFTENPQLPFEELKLKLNGGPRAPLASPQTCGAAVTSADLTPWSTSGLGGLSGTEPIEGTPDAYPSSSFNVDWDGDGGACPGSLPFAPAFSAGMASTAAGVYSPLTVQFSREDREQDLAGITVHTPVGVLANLSSIPLCGEPQASQGTCAAASQIGSTSAAVGPGSHPFWITDGRVYLTTGYKGAPFGLSIVVPADAGPFHLGNVVVRASIAINPHTAAITVTSDPLPQIWDGVPLRLRTVNVDVNRPGFMFNATSCAQQQLTAAITGAPPVNDPGEPGKSGSVSSAYEVGGCAGLAFKPGFAVSTSAKTSKADGASLTAKVSYPNAAQGTQADIAAVKVDLPKQLPSRLTTLQKACTNAQFEANPADCPAGSFIGHAVVHTPILPVALEGPAIFVSHGGEAFPSLTLVLQGDNVTIDLVGSTFISKAGVTSTTFKTVPDAPFSTFELTLPEGPYSALAANGNLCTSKLAMPTAFVAQNGAEIHESTKIAVTGCTPSKSTVKITKTKLQGNTLLVTVTTSATGRVRISGNGLKTTVHKNVKAGTHRFRVALTKAGKKAKQQRKRLKLRASLTVGKQTVAKTTSVKL